MKRLFGNQKKGVRNGQEREGGSNGNQGKFQIVKVNGTDVR